MVFRVIEGGLAIAAPADTACEQPSREDVEHEAERRLRAINYQMWERREAVVGISMPREIKYLAMQVIFAAQAIASLRRIPQDFQADFYWPALDELLAVRTGP
ncbi:hypothetical protein EPK99_18570 [Neorhizobium lilium]|uniref:Uncharacterized protein n=1 Tax=Neorhizobium lilium TaxID=2503024 RepID=A0A444LD39_9HYPH|nr:hypothetical protein [Neorhizobium lilium]RWX75695.1 hypothetical protein EPK99_18570 [Neorhizobium lilium]